MVNLKNGLESQEKQRDKTVDPSIQRRTKFLTTAENTS